MCFKNRNLQNDSKVKTCKECIDDCKECIDKKALDSISRWIVSFYLFLIAIPVSAVFIFKINHSINCKVNRKVNRSICSSICNFVCSSVNDIKTNPNNLIYVIVYFIILSLCIGYIYLRYFNPQKTKCKEIYDDLKLNCISMACSAVSSLVLLSISAYCSSNCVTKITVSLALLFVTCFIGLRAKSCNSKYALTKIDIDRMNTMNKYSNTNGCEEECELLVIKMSYLKYYKVMETNYLMMSAFFVFVTSVLGKFY
ncbi:permease [Gardnerella piotii]|uniref:permease n=1 Tax=Gardnerella piotii TaxID=2792977 RepID=UPI003CE493B2